ncbi:MAG: hypothetical protein WDW38_007491 [Sanguina aurantia]
MPQLQGSCSQAWYCNPECRTAHLTSGNPPHGLVCACLKRFSGFKLDNDMECILVMCLGVLALQQQQQQQQQQSATTTAGAKQQQQQQQSQPNPAGETCIQSSSSSSGSSSGSGMTHADFLLLGGHADKWKGEELKDWSKGVKFLRAALVKSRWSGTIPDERALMEWASRIESNNFGLFALRQRGKADADWESRTPHQPTPSASSTPVPVSSSSSQHSGVLAVPAAAAAAAAAAAVPVLSVTRPGLSAALTGLHIDTASLRGKPAQASATGGGSHIDSASLRAKPAQAHATGGRSSLTDFVLAGAGDCREELTGRQLYITTSYFNHSCRPNCFMDHSSAAAVVRATEAVASGEEVCITYTDISTPRATRAALLQRYFHFKCNCLKCAEELAAGTVPKRRG